MEIFSTMWTEIIIRPMINSLMLLYSLLFNNFGFSIIVFTIIIRAATTPLTLRQLKQTKALSALTPKLKSIQEKYKEDKQKLSQETMKLYKNAGVNPVGCLGPLVIQMPIWIGLFQALRELLAHTPETMVSLSEKMYGWVPSNIIPISNHFLWFNLGTADNQIPILPILVGISTWAQQKMSTPTAADARQESTNKMMLWMMPLMLAFFAFNFPAGLSLYWIASNVVGIIIHAFIVGFRPTVNSLNPLSKRLPAEQNDPITHPEKNPLSAEQNENESLDMPEEKNEQQNIHGKNFRRSDRTSGKRTRNNKKKH